MGFTRMRGDACDVVVSWVSLLLAVCCTVCRPFFHPLLVLQLSYLSALHIVIGSLSVSLSIILIFLWSR
ncbi:hypothetical protein EDB83DRAFT_2409714, partial [Lactarius deliciosus]